MRRTFQQPPPPPEPAPRPFTRIRTLLTTTIRTAISDDVPDQAAALTYYLVLSLFPAAIAVFAIVGMFASGPQAMGSLLQIARELGGPQLVSAIREPLEQLAQQSRGIGLPLILGIGGAVWGASGYVSAFGRTLNRIHNVREHRKFFHLLGVQLGTTIAVVLLAVISAIALTIGGPFAHAIGTSLGLSGTFIDIWGWLRFVVLAAVAVALLIVLFRWSGNVHQTWWSWGAVLALFGWTIATAIFGWYVSTFANLQHSYGPLSSVIALLLWLWLSNVVVLFGAEFDLELGARRR